MKKKNCCCDYTASRNERLRQEFLRRLGRNVRNLRVIFAELATAPAERFYINEDRAYYIIKERIRRGEWPSMLPTRRRMLELIYAGAMALREADPSLTLRQAVCDAVNSPAPGYFLTPRSIRTIIYENLKKYSSVRLGGQERSTPTSPICPAHNSK